MLWIPVAFMSGCLVGGLAGGFIGTAGAKKKIEALQKRLEAAESRSSELLDKFDKQADKALETASAALQRDMEDLKFSAAPPKSSLDEEPVEKVEERDRARKEPFCISEEEYRNELATIDEDNLIYYKRDGVFSDNAGNELEAPEMLIGEEIKNGLINGDFDYEEKIYVHNEQREMNFVIEINDVSHFYNDVDVSDFY